MAKEFGNPHDITELDVKIEGKDWDDDEVQLLACRHLLIADNMREFWTGAIDRGKQAFEYMKGDIFDSKTRAAYKKKDMFPVEPRVMESRIYSLVGQIIRGRRSGAITSEGGTIDNPSDSAAAISVANMVLKHMEQAWKERRLEKDILHDALVSCYPTWFWIEKGLPSMGEGVLNAKLLPWDSTAVAPFHFRYANEITGISYRRPMKESELIEMYPDMEEQIRVHREYMQDEDAKQISSIAEWGGLSEGDRSNINNISTSAETMLNLPNAYFEVWFRVFQLHKKEKILINLQNPKDFHIKPPDWDNARWKEFAQQRAQKSGVEYAQDTRKVTVLWSTVGTTSRLMLENKMHWYQEDGQMPGAPLWPAMIDGDIMGPGEKMRTNVLKIACAETEFLDEVRKGSGSVWLVRSGMLKNADNFDEETSKSNGLLEIDGTFPGSLDNVVRNIDRRPNQSSLDYAMKCKQDIEDETRINQAIQGQTNPDQSGIAKTMEIAQGMIAQSDYVENFNLWWEMLQDLKCKMIPYGYNQHDILEITDEKAPAPVKMPINAPIRDISGEVVGIANDLTSHEFKFRLTAVDDSPTAKLEEQKQALIFLNSVPGPMAAIDPSGEMLALFMMALPNKILQDVGKRLQAKAKEKGASQEQQAQTEQLMKSNERLMKLKNEAEKIKNSKVAVSLTGDQLSQFPALYQLLQEVGFFTPAQAPVPPEGGPMMPEAAGALPPMQPGPQMPTPQPQ